MSTPSGRGRCALEASWRRRDETDLDTGDSAPAWHALRAGCDSARSWVAVGPGARRDRVGDPADRGRDPRGQGGGRGDLQPDRRRLRPGAVSGSDRRCSTACGRRWRPGRRTTRRRTACSALREAVARFYARHLGLSYPVESVLITGGARPLLYGSYRPCSIRGDAAVYPVPSWNNNHYATCPARAPIEIPVRADANFFPTPDDLRPHLPSARLLLINSPLNPTGTVIDPEVLAPHLRAGRRGEPAARTRGGDARQGALALLRPGLLAARVWRQTAGPSRHAARGVRRRRALHDHPRRRVEELRRDRAARRLGGDAARRAPADGGHPGSRRRLGAAARAGGDGGAARRRGRGRRLSDRDARPRPAAAGPPGGRVRGDARGRLSGRGDRAAGGDLPVGARRDSKARPTRRPASCCWTRPASRWCRSRRSACARTAAGSASRSARCRWPRSTPRFPRLRAALARDGNRCPRGICRRHRAGAGVARRRCSRSPTTNTATRRCAR